MQTITLMSQGIALAADHLQPEGPTRGAVVLLHGGGQTRHSWGRTAERLVTDGWSVVNFDARGHGESGWSEAGDYSLSTGAADLAEVITTLGIAPAVLCGASMGGVTALRLQADRPELVRGLILVDITPRVEPEGVARIIAFMSSAPDGFASLEEAAEAVAAYSRRPVRRTNLDGLKKNLRLREDGRWHWHWDPAFLRSAPREPDRNVRTEELIAAASAVTAPTLLVRGGSSDVVSSEGAQELLALIPHASLVDVAGAGHMVAGDDNDTFGTAIQAFLDNLPAFPLPA